MKTKHLKFHRKLLEYIHQTGKYGSKRQRQFICHILSKAPEDFINCLEECCLNILNKNIELTKKQKKYLRKYRKVIIGLADKNQYLDAMDDLELKRKLNKAEQEQPIEFKMKPEYDEVEENLGPYRYRAQKILQKIIEHPSFIGWNEKKEINISGKPISGSNINDLLKVVITPAKYFKGIRDPEGLEKFIEALAKVNLPNQTFGNKKHLDTLIYYKSGRRKELKRRNQKEIYISPKKTTIDIRDRVSNSESKIKKAKAGCKTY